MVSNCGIETHLEETNIDIVHEEKKVGTRKRHNNTHNNRQCEVGMETRNKTNSEIPKGDMFIKYDFEKKFTSTLCNKIKWKGEHLEYHFPIVHGWFHERKGHGKRHPIPGSNTQNPCEYTKVSYKRKYMAMEDVLNSTRQDK